MDLKKLREKAGLSQSELASRTGLTQAQVSRYEQAPESVSATVLITIFQALGLDPQTAMSLLMESQQVETPINPGAPYSKLEQNFELLKLYLEQAVGGPDEASDHQFTAENVRERIRRVSQRPKLVVAGAFDTGKSHLINRLLGKDLLPTGYTPMTKIAIHIHHRDLKPDGLSENVVVLGPDEQGQKFDVDHCHDLDYIRAHELMRGNAQTLKDCGTHDGEMNIHGAQLALVFDDAPILNACSIIDTPGNLHDIDDLHIADAAASEADILVYTSPANGFMNGADFTCLESYLDKLPLLFNLNKNLLPLGNLFFVATHASPSFRNEDLKKILDTACKRMFKTLGETVLKRKYEKLGVQVTENDLRKRFFTFWREIPDRRKDFEAELSAALSTEIPKAVILATDSEISNIKTSAQLQLKAKIEGYEATKRNISEMGECLKTLKEGEAAFKQRLHEKRDNVTRYIQERLSESGNTVKPIWDRFIETTAIEKVIRDKFEDKKEAQQHAAQHVLSQIQDSISRQLEEDSLKMAPLVEEYLQELKVVSFKSCTGAEVVEIPLNAEGAFMGGLAGAVGIGALAVYASTFGSLGGYILVAKGVSILSAIGIGISGGTATAISAVSAIGGPITIAIGLGLLAMLAGFAFFGSWEKRLAKNIVAHLEKNMTREKFVKGISDFWTETEQAFNDGALAAEATYDQKLVDLEKLVSNPVESIEKINRIQKELEETRAFFANMPWKMDGGTILPFRGIKSAMTSKKSGLDNAKNS